MVIDDSKPYRKGVGVMVFNSQGLVFVGQRVDFDCAWQMPQGGLDDGEDPGQGALRELREETNITSVQVVATSSEWYYYDFPKDLGEKLWNGQFRGQAQKWFLMAFFGDESEINLQNHCMEFSNWKWIEMQELPNIIVPFKKEIYTKVINEFHPLIKKYIDLKNK